MSEQSQYVSYKRPAIEFKSNTFTVPVLILGTNDLNIIAEQLKIKIKQAPEFFKNSPLLFDLQDIVKDNMDLDLIQLHKTVLDLKFIPIGIRGGTIEHNKIAHSINMAVFSNLHTKYIGHTLILSINLPRWVFNRYLLAFK
jgi:septum site-determining protein MinC